MTKPGALLWGGLAASLGLLTYGALVEAYRLKPERRTLGLRDWPSHLDGLRVGLLADLHLGPRSSSLLVRQAIDWVVAESPDVTLILGDIVGHWEEGLEDLVAEVLAPLAPLAPNVLAIPGNHDYFCGPAQRLISPLSACGISLLVNEVAVREGVNWFGIDSGNEGYPDPFTPLFDANHDLPTVALWHEPDFVNLLPRGLDLMLSGHSHGGQFVFPWGYAPMTTVNGSEYVSGYYPGAPTPLYVSRGLATTGPASRFCCRPEVTLLTLSSLQQ